MKERIEKVVRDGYVAVLYSPGFGAGWSSWNKGKPECLFSPEIVALVEAGKAADITDRLCETLFGEDFYCGGSTKLEIKWLKEGTAFLVDEYDGSESITIRDNTDWLIA